MKIIQYFNHLSLVPPRHCFVIEANPVVIYDDIKIMDDWLLANVNGRYRRSERRMAGRFIVDVYDERDAMMFKLVWA